MLCDSYTVVLTRDVTSRGLCTIKNNACVAISWRRHEDARSLRFRFKTFELDSETPRDSLPCPSGHLKLSRRAAPRPTFSLRNLCSCLGRNYFQSLVLSVAPRRIVAQISERLFLSRVSQVFCVSKCNNAWRFDWYLIDNCIRQFTLWCARLITHLKTSLIQLRRLINRRFNITARKIINFRMIFAQRYIITYC